MGKFASNLEKIRTERKMTQEELAKRVGVSQPAIAQYENGSTVPRMNIAIKIAEVLQISIESLITGKE